jgi:membrane protein
LIIGIEIIGGLLASSLGQLSKAAVERLQDFNLNVPSLNLSWGIGLWTELLRIIIATTVFTLCFRFLPRQSSSWAGALAGALFSIGSILLMRWLFERSFNPAQFTLIYGVITSLLIILLWLYFALLLFLTGALIVAEISVGIRARRLLGTEVDAKAIQK